MAKRALAGIEASAAAERDQQLDADQAKAQLARRVVEAIEARSLTQADAAVLLGIDQPKVSRLLRSHTTEFSVARLLRFITLLGRDIEIVIHPTREEVPVQQGRLRVVAANRTSFDAA